MFLWSQCPSPPIRIMQPADSNLIYHFEELDHLMARHGASSEADLGLIYTPAASPVFSLLRMQQQMDVLTASGTRVELQMTAAAAKAAEAQGELRGELRAAANQAASAAAAVTQVRGELHAATNQAASAAAAAAKAAKTHVNEVETLHEGIQRNISDAAVARGAVERSHNLVLAGLDQRLLQQTEITNVLEAKLNRLGVQSVRDKIPTVATAIIQRLHGNQPQASHSQLCELVDASALDALDRFLVQHGGAVNGIPIPREVRRWADRLIDLRNNSVCHFSSDVALLAAVDELIKLVEDYPAFVNRTDPDRQALVVGAKIVQMVGHHRGIPAV